VKLPNEVAEVLSEAPASQPKLTLVAILAALLGVLVTLIATGSWWHYQQRAALDAQVQSLKEVVKQKNIALADLQAQNASLAKHLSLLKGYSIASSTFAAAPAEHAVPAGSEARPTSASGKAKKAKPLDCELVGKTPEQQAATLQRCVKRIDSAAAKSRL
jgi:hypothetical protein